MKVQVRGYSRDCGWTTVAEADVASIDLPRRMSWYKSGGASVRRTTEGIVVNKSPIRLTLNGRYVLSTHLSKEEIGSMFLQLFADDNLSDAFSALAAIKESRRLEREKSA